MAGLLVLSGCVQDMPPSAAPQVVAEEEIPLPTAPPRALTVAIYNCNDTTGQRRPTGASQELSSAVPMDCTPYLVEAVRSLQPGYLYLVERQHLDELIRERQLATLALSNTPQQAVAGHPAGASKLTMIRVAEVLLVGQVVAYDRATREVSGGAAVGGIGIDSTVVTDQVTFSLRAIAVQTGEILGQTTVTKSITSQKTGGHIAKVFSTSTMELELGGAGNEPVGLALRAAIRSALDQLVQNGIHDGWWT
jgi:curli biogenesis system outer membrane secretion channel CsgG